jgi:flavin-binding protein dodecin
MADLRPLSGEERKSDFWAVRSADNPGEAGGQLLFSRSPTVDPNQWPRRRGIPCFLLHTEWEDDMPESVYDVILLIGSSKESWEKAAANAVEQASKSLRNLRVAEIVELDMQLDAKGKVEAYRAKVRLSFKVER